MQDGKYLFTATAVALTLGANGAAFARQQDQPLTPAPATDSPPLSLPSQGGGSLGSLTVEGASQVRIRFERPALKLDLDPLSAPGLECEPTIAILERTPPDLALPLLRASAAEHSARTPRPWLCGFTTGSLTRLRQDVQGVARWQLEIVASDGSVACARSGEGAPPRELPWDGIRDDGTPAPAGQAYSHVLTARDKAGNTRRFVGDSFRLPAYRVDTAGGPCLLFSAAHWRESFGEGGVSPLLLEAATVLNLRADAGRGLVVTAAAATAEEAEAIGNEVVEALAARVGGGEGRLRLETVLTPGAPAGGTVRVAVAGQR